MSAILKPMPQETRCPQCGLRAASIVCHICKTNKLLPLENAIVDAKLDYVDAKESVLDPLMANLEKKYGAVPEAIHSAARRLSAALEAAPEE